MCGCMLMHVAMNHEEQNQPASQSARVPTANASLASSVRQCFHCSFPLQQSFAFCPNCGTRLQTAECEACGQKVDSSWKACVHCGAPLGEAQAA